MNKRVIFNISLQVDSFILDENDVEDSEPGLESSKYLLASEADSQGIQTVDPQTQARLEALLEAAGIVYSVWSYSTICLCVLCK